MAIASIISARDSRGVLFRFGGQVIDHRRLINLENPPITKFLERINAGIDWFLQSLHNTDVSQVSKEQDS